MSNARTLASLIDGNNIVVPSGFGLDFGTSTSGTGTVTSGVMDDYEEGNWNPSADVAPSGTIDTTTGEYVKIGRVVYVYIRISGSNLAISSYAQFSGLPFPSTVTGSGYFTTNAISANIGGEVAIGSTQFYFGSTTTCTLLVATAFYFTNS